MQTSELVTINGLTHESFHVHAGCCTLACTVQGYLYCSHVAFV